MTISETMHRIRADHEIHGEVRDELRWDPSITNERAVDIAVDSGIVTLYGTADSYAQKWAIERAAYRVRGVRSVSNELEVQLPKDDVRSDGELTRAATRALEWDARVPRGVTAEALDGTVHLRGNVERIVDRLAAEDAVRNLLGIAGVVNAIQVISGPPAPDVHRLIESAIERHGIGPNEDVRVVVDGDVIHLSGTVPTVSMRDEIDQIATFAPGITSVDDQIQIA